MMSEVVLQHLSAGVLTLALNRPDQGNAFSRALREQLLDAVRGAADNAEAKVVVLRGEGRGFSVGGDLRDLSSGVAITQDNHRRRVAELREHMEVVHLLASMPKPCIAMLHGAAAGAGLALALACDLRLAARSATFTTAFNRVALSGDYGGSYFLTRLVGTAKARELYLDPRSLDAASALQLGIVNRVCDDDDLVDETRQLAQRLADGPTLAQGHIKRNLDLALHGTLAQCLDAEAARHIDCVLTEDHQEAVQAFLNKRRPLFRGR